MSKEFKSAVQKTNLAEKQLEPLFQKSNTDNNKNTSNTSNTSNTAQKDIRQTFVLSAQALDKLKDYVHYRRLQGDTNFTQKQALNEALETLFKKVPNLPKRNS